MDRKGNPGFVEDVNKLHGIKCVVVGDRGVGKSHLVCAKASGTKYTMRDLVQTHISTIWAVDQYRTNPDVQRRSICTVECVTCSLRLWDTFGNHEKDRQFAYSNADVVLACFSVANKRSLKHIATHWIPEIKYHCDNVPIVICACQIDMRYLYNDPAYAVLSRENFHRKVTADDIVLPDEGKQLANSLGAFYYETSVLVQYGIDEVFANCVRAALISKRRGMLFVNFGTLKNVVRPHLQVPHMPPRPPPPKLVSYEKEYESESDAAMLNVNLFSDVVFLVQGQKFEAHRVYLVAASPVFQWFFEDELCITSDMDQESERPKSCLVGSTSRLLLRVSDPYSQETLTNDSYSQSTATTTTFSRSGLGRKVLSVTNEMLYRNSDNDTGIGEDDSLVCSSNCLSRSHSIYSKENVKCSKHRTRQRSVSSRQYSARYDPRKTRSFLSSISTGRLLDIENVDESANDEDIIEDSGYFMRTPTISTSCLSDVFVCRNINHSENGDQVVISVDERIAPGAFRLVLHYLYTGQLSDTSSPEVLQELMDVAKILGLEDLASQIMNILNDENFFNLELNKKFQEQKTERIRQLFLEQDYLSDMMIHLDDGMVSGHRALLAARCEMMSTMFTANFSERSTGLASFPGVSKESFLGVQEYLYTGKCPVTCKDWIGLIELTDRLFLKDLLLSAEVVIIRELSAAMETGAEVVEMALALLESAKLHSANKLAEWCLWLLKVNYRDLIENNAKSLELFDPEMQADLARDRWPPEWYLKEVEIYEKAMLEMNKMRPQQSWLRRSDGEACISPRGCLWSFWKKK